MTMAAAFAFSMPTDPPTSHESRRLALQRELGLGDGAAPAALDVLVDALLASREQVQTLRAEHQRVLDFGRASGDWMWETDDALRYAWISDAFEAVTGLKAASLLGRTLPDL